MYSSWYLVDIDTELAQVHLGLVNLVHELLVRLGDVVESKDTEAETEEEEGTKGDEGPEGKLFARRWLVSPFASVFVWARGEAAPGASTYDGDDLLLDQSGERDKLKVESEVELQR